LLAASLTVLFGSRYWSTKHLLESASAATLDEATMPGVVSPQVVPMPPPVAVIPTAIAVLAPQLSPHVALPLPPVAAPTPQPVMRRAPKARPATVSAAPKAPACVAKVDPATGKTIYKGDCD
jgi:hypothetical protein